MAKLFKLALESSDLEGAVAPEATQPVLDEAELEQNVEETTQEQAEIEQGEEEIDQALEEADGLVEQIEANDEKLENPDAVVTAADVEVSEEALKRACYSLGIPFQAKLSFASESVANDIRANARKYLATSNEELKDRFRQIAEAIRKMIITLTKKISIYINKMELRSSNYWAAIQNSLNKISEKRDELRKLADGIPEYEDVYQKIIDKLQNNSAETRYALMESEVYLTGITKLRENVAQLKDIFKTSAEAFKSSLSGEDITVASDKMLKAVETASRARIDNSLFAIKPINVTVDGNLKIQGEILGITGKSCLDNMYKVQSVEFEEYKFSPDWRKLIDSVLSVKGTVSAARLQLDAKLKLYTDVQNEIIKELSGMKIDGDDSAKQSSYAYRLSWIRRCACSASFFRMKEFIGEIKAYKVIVEALCDLVDVHNKFTA